MKKCRVRKKGLIGTLVGFAIFGSTAFALMDTYGPIPLGQVLFHEQVIEKLFEYHVVDISKHSKNYAVEAYTAFKVLDRTTGLQYFVKVYSEDFRKKGRINYEWSLKIFSAVHTDDYGYSFVFPITGADYYLDETQYRAVVYPFIAAPTIRELIVENSESIKNQSFFMLLINYFFSTDDPFYFLKNVFQQFGCSMAYINHGMARANIDATNLVKVNLDDRHPGNVLYSQSENIIHMVDLNTSKRYQWLTIEDQLADTFKSWYLTLRYPDTSYSVDYYMIIYSAFRRGYTSVFDQEDTKQSIAGIIDSAFLDAIENICSDLEPLACRMINQFKERADYPKD